ncbi:hypothetical protein ACIRD8_31445 [Streptomyces sp. NPDC102451]|uniref:hypothetical protein n=1 Tax=Streptomyces sp. NPDC102451 TaxID=3366177 RepID=UPI003811FFDE
MRRLLWPAAAACFLVAGCGASGHEGPGGGEPELPRPLSGAVHLSPAQAVALRRSEESRVRSCMRERGHVYRTVPVSDPHTLTAENPYGLLEARRSRDDGYGLTAGQVLSRPQDPNASHLSTLSEAESAAWRTALLGDEKHRRTLTLPDGVEIRYDPRSCVEVASGAVYGKRWTELHHLMESLTGDIADAVRRTPGFRKAEQAWAGCMAEKGHAFRRLSDPRAETGRRLEKAGGDAAAQRDVGRAELRLAGEDLACQREAGLAAAVAKAQAGAERKSRERWRQEIEDHRAMKASALAGLGRTAG